jgi:hypothetical protein
MLRILWLNVSTIMVHMRECMVHVHGVGARRRAQSSEEVVADLYTYLEQLNAKCGELEGKVQKCNQRALFHRQRAATEATRHCKQRELNRAKLYLQDKHRLQEDQDRTLRFMHLIRQQIDSLNASQMDNIMVDAMRQYNMTAKRMGLPDKSKEIESLSSEIQARFTEVDELQHMLSEATDPCSIGLLKEEDDDDLMMELNALCESDDAQGARLKAETEDVEEAEDLPTTTTTTTTTTMAPLAAREPQQLRQRLVPSALMDEHHAGATTATAYVHRPEEEPLLVA